MAIRTWILLSSCLPLAAEERPWYMQASSFHFPALYTEDFNGTVLLESIQEQAHDKVLVDFYAPWCPHCQHFAPEFELLALAAQQSLAKDKLLLASVDCVRYAETCREWGVTSYPSLRLADKASWAKGNAHVSIVRPEDTTALGVATWLRDNAGPGLDLVAEVQQLNVSSVVHRHVAEQPVQNQEGPQHGDAQLAMALLLRNIFSYGVFESDSDGQRQALLSFLDLAAKRFPEAGAGTPCRTSLQELQLMLRDNWGSFLQRQPMFVDPNKIEARWKLCSTDWDDYKDGWQGCKGTWPGKRGYTCGLWHMFHSLIARSTDQDASKDLETLRETIHRFFECESCVKHFDSIPTPQELPSEDPLSRKGAMLWLWHAHNLVNRRVANLEQEYGDNDPAFPKVQWPSQELCPKCRASMSASFLTLSKQEPDANLQLLARSWNEDKTDLFNNEKWSVGQVLDFLEQAHGEAASV